MLRVYHLLAVEHDLSLVSLALGICLFASVTSLIVVQRGIVAAFTRLRWLLFGGVVTGVGIWTTHFAAMLAYDPGVEMRIDGLRVLASILIAVALSAAAWVIGFRRLPHRGGTAGFIVGLALAAAVSIDMTALRVAGSISYDIDLILVAIVGGVGLCTLAGRRLQRERGAPLPLRSAALLGFGVLFLHFVAIASLTATPQAAAVDPDALPLSEIGGAVVAASMLLLGVAFGLGYHERRIASAIIADRKRLNELVAALEESEARQRLVLRSTNDVIWDWNHASDSVIWSDAVESVLGYPEALHGTSAQWFFDRLHPDDAAGAAAIYRNIRTVDQTYWNNEYRVRHAAGHYVHMFARGYVVRDSRGMATRSVGALLDVSAQKKVETELRFAAQHDPLTRLPNRALFNERLASALAQAEQTGRRVALSVIDLDDFKTLNDRMGHAAGDALLREVADRLVGHVPADATVARLGGDEFAVIFPSLLADDTRPETLERIIAAMAEPLLIDGRTATISLSAGAAVWPQDGDDADAVLKSADLALYAAKASGPNTIRMFTASMRDAAERQRRMLSDARHALDEERIFPCYQPKVCLRTGRLLGFEALLRWNDLGNGVLGPGSIEAALHDGELSVQITDRMLDNAIADMRHWTDRGLDYGRIAVNGSTVDFLRRDFAHHVIDRLQAAGLPASCFELEVTETVLLGQLASNVERALEALSAAGISIALDDFGTGYASLTHLKQFPVDSLKIDRSFISRMTTGSEDAAIVAAVIDLARNLSIATVAEGVETPSQARMLVAHGCDMAQGYFFSRAIPAADVPALIAGWDTAAIFARMEKPARSAGS